MHILTLGGTDDAVTWRRFQNRSCETQQREGRDRAEQRHRQTNENTQPWSKPPKKRGATSVERCLLRLQPDLYHVQRRDCKHTPHTYSSVQFSTVQHQQRQTSAMPSGKKKTKSLTTFYRCSTRGHLMPVGLFQETLHNNLLMRRDTGREQQAEGRRGLSPSLVQQHCPLNQSQLGSVPFLIFTSSPCLLAP